MNIHLDDYQARQVGWSLSLLGPWLHQADEQVLDQLADVGFDRHPAPAAAARRDRGARRGARSFSRAWRCEVSELLSVRIRAHAVKLGLTHLAESVQTTLAHAEADQCSYLQLLDLILDEEVGQREGRRFRNALNLSGLPHRKTLDDFDFAFQPDLDPRKIRGLASLTFVEDNSNVVFLGPPGVGKTMLAVALAVAACPGRLLDLLHPPSMT